MKRIGPYLLAAVMVAGIESFAKLLPAAVCGSSPGGTEGVQRTAG